MDAKHAALKKKLDRILKEAAELGAEMQALEQGPGTPHYDQIESHPARCWTAAQPAHAANSGRRYDGRTSSRQRLPRLWQESPGEHESPESTLRRRPRFN